MLSAFFFCIHSFPAFSVDQGISLLHQIMPGDLCLRQDVVTLMKAHLYSLDMNLHGVTHLPCHPPLIYHFSGFHYFISIVEWRYCIHMTVVICKCLP